MKSLSEKRVGEVALVLLLVLGVYAWLARKYVLIGRLNADEGFYCLAAKKALAGQVPYRDFAYSQMPVLPYVNGLIMKIVGFGYLHQRIVNATWGLATLAAVFCLGLCIAGRYAGLVAAWLTATSLYWVHFVCMGKTYAATGFFLMLAALGICVPWSYYRKVLFFTAAGVLAIGCRLTAAPAVGVLGVFLILQGRGTRDRIIAAALPAAACLALFLPFFLADPENFIFWNVEYHAGSWSAPRVWEAIGEHLWLAPGVLVLMLAGTVGAIAKFRQVNRLQWGVLLAGIVGIATQLSLRSPYRENSVPYVALGAIAAAAILTRWGWFKRFRAIVLVLPLLAWPGPKPVTEPFILKSLLDSAKFVEDHTSPDERVLTPYPIVAIEANREVFDGLEMGKFALTCEMPEERARRLHLVTPRTLTELARSARTVAVVLRSYRSAWNFGYSVPGLRVANEREMNLFWQAVEQRYRIAFTQFPFVVALRKG